MKDLYLAEKVLCNRLASECAAVLAAGGLAHVTSAANVYWQQVTTDNERDAFRHSYWNAAMIIRIGFAKAKEWADAHEYGNPKRKANSIGEWMDFYNNSVGRNIGNEAMVVLAAYRDSEIVARVKSGIKSGRMRIVSRLYAAEPQATGRALVLSNTYSSIWPMYW